MAGILEGITVVDLSRLIAGPVSAMALADLGARVIKVEALAGEDGRHLGPPFYGQSARFVAHPELPGLPLIPFPAHLTEGMLSPDRMAPPPRTGQHSAALLRELGCDAQEVRRLVRDRVVRLADPAP
jgi:crotonobetainyl-CoA:carnitine CoA-transferase CaiB-like acyl-CoA transferase